MSTRSSSLFHFTNNEEVIFDILKNGFWPKYCLEDIDWQNLVDYKFMAFPMVCFCDIPLARISEHIDFYGSFGIGLSKNWAQKNNLNPVFYLSSGSSLTKNMREILVKTVGNESINEREKLINNLRYFVAHCKQRIGKIDVEGEPTKKNFYQESEWRYVPQNENIRLYLRKEEVEKGLESFQRETKKYTSLKFLPCDISYIFVPTDSDIPSIINFMQTELDHYPSADLKVLYSKVTSVESINRDI